MEQKELRALEYRCIQEELPLCTATCPLHIDARGFIGKIASGAWDEAWKILTRNMPVPNILARICDHPCEPVCKRREAGGSIALSELEKVCVSRVNRKVKASSVPKREDLIAVVGTGLSSLVAAWDLLFLGYHVTILEANDRPGDAFLVFPEHILPRSVIEEEIAVIQAMGGELRTNVLMTQEKRWLEELSDQFDAIYVGLDAGIIPDSLLLDVGMVDVDPITLATGIKGVFAGGLGTRRKPISAILDAADGRKGATSIDRFVQNVSLTAAREGEGPRDTRLYTNIENIAAEPVVPKTDVEGRYTDEEAIREAQRCIQCECMECVKNCLYLERFKGYPKRYIREIYNNEAILMGSHGQTNRLINSCSLCGLCGVVCPNDISMVDVCLEGRRKLVAKGKMPPSAHDFALEDMFFNNSDRFALTRHEPGMEKSQFFFFPGCQLSGSSPEQVERVYEYLRQRLSGGVGLMLRCCNAPAFWAGQEALFRAEVELLRDELATAGRPRMILACPTCYKVYKEHLPEVEIISLWELLDEIGLSSSPHPSKHITITVHDPCTSRLEQGMQESVRRLLRHLGYTVEEVPLSGLKTECCGYGGLMSAANQPLARDVAKKRADEATSDWVTYCAMCRDSLSKGDKHVAHILDLIFEGSENRSAVGRKVPGYSERHENRARLKERMLSKVFGEEGKQLEQYEQIVLHISSEVSERMEERRILVEDVQRVIDHAERTGERIFNKKTGHWVASFRPRTVTFWVEYTGTPQAYTVYNSYCHRMEIMGEHLI
jgi:NADPH-dependent glutamate synthase beta subunit-like oxidoreductase